MPHLFGFNGLGDMIELENITKIYHMGKMVYFKKYGVAENLRSRILASEASVISEAQISHSC